MGLKKYEFKNLKEFKEFELETHHKPIILGHVVLDGGKYDTEGNVVKAPIRSDKFCVDIYWNDNEDSSILDEFEVFPNSPKHKIA